MKRLIIAVAILMMCGQAWAGNYVLGNPLIGSQLSPRLGPELMGAAGALADSTLWITSGGSGIGTLGWTMGPNGATGVSTSTVPAKTVVYILPNPSYNRTYLVTYRIVSRTAGSVRVYLGGYNQTTPRSSVGTWSEIVTVTNPSSNVLVYFGAFSSFTGTIANLSVRELIP